MGRLTFAIDIPLKVLCESVIFTPQISAEKFSYVQGKNIWIHCQLRNGFTGVRILFGDTLSIIFPPIIHGYSELSESEKRHIRSSFEIAILDNFPNFFVFYFDEDFLDRVEGLLNDDWHRDKIQIELFYLWSTGNEVDQWSIVNDRPRSTTGALGFDPLVNPPKNPVYYPDPDIEAPTEFAYLLRIPGLDFVSTARDCAHMEFFSIPGVSSIRGSGRLSPMPNHEGAFSFAYRGSLLTILTQFPVLFVERGAPLPTPWLELEDWIGTRFPDTFSMRVSGDLLYRYQCEHGYDWSENPSQIQPFFDWARTHPPLFWKIINPGRNPGALPETLQ